MPRGLSPTSAAPAEQVSHGDHSWKHCFLRQLCHLPGFRPREPVRQQGLPQASSTGPCPPSFTLPLLGNHMMSTPEPPPLADPYFPLSVWGLREVGRPVWPP